MIRTLILIFLIIEGGYLLITPGWHEPYPEKNVMGFAEFHFFPLYKEGDGIVWNFELNILLRFY